MTKLTARQYFLKLAEQYNDLGMELEMLHTTVCTTAETVAAAKDVSTDNPHGNSWDYFKLAKQVESLHRSAPYLLDQKAQDEILIMANKFQDMAEKLSKVCT